MTLERIGNEPLHFVERAFGFREVFHDTSRNQTISRNLNRARIALFLQGFRAEQRFSHMIGNDLTEFRIRHAVAGDEIGRLNLKTELRCSRFERIGLFINQVREFIGVGGELANRLLLRILALDLALHVFERFNCSRMNVGHVDHMPAEFRFNRADNIALLGVKYRIFKSLRHDAAAEEGQITALFCAARVNGIGLGEFSKLRRISLHFIGKFFSLLAGSFLVIAELDQNMTCAALFRNGPALLILFVKVLRSSRLAF